MDTSCLGKTSGGDSEGPASSFNFFTGKGIFCKLMKSGGEFSLN